MEREEFNNIVMVLNATYSTKNYTMISSKEQALVWYTMLSDLDYTIARQAVVNLIARSPYQPTVADIRNEYASLTNRAELGEAEAWTMVRDGIRNGTYGATEEFSKFPAAIQRAVGSPMSLSEWAMLSSSEVETVVQSQFLRAYRAACAEQKTENALGAIGAKKGSMVELAEQIAKRLDGVRDEQHRIGEWTIGGDEHG